MNIIIENEGLTLEKLSTFKMSYGILIEIKDLFS